MMRNLLAVVVLLGLVVWGVLDAKGKDGQSAASGAEAGQAVQSEVTSGVRKGDIALDFELASLDGATKIKLSDYRGKKVVLNYWASWCGPCRVEMPHMEKFYEDYKDKGVVLIGVNLTHTEKTINDVSSFVQKNNLTFPVALDEKGYVSDNYNVMAYPTTFIIDSKGVIRDIFLGAIDYNTLKTAVSRVK